MAVNIYRAVADYMQDLITTVQQQGSAITDFNGGSGARTLFEAFSTELSLQSLIANQLRQDMFIATAVGQALDDKAADFQVQRLPAIQATGTIRMTQVTPGATIFVPAGTVPLATLGLGASNPPIAVVTTADATLPSGTAYIDIPATAVAGGASGNLAGGTPLIPSTPVNGIVSVGGFEVTPGTGFTGGVDVETDDAFRARIPIAVQGRVPGRAVAFQAAAMGIAGVLGACVVSAGQSDGTITVEPPNVEVFFSGSASLLAAVQTACNGVAILDQNVTAYVATADRCVVTCTVTALSGTDPVALTAAVLAAVQGVINAVAPGGTAYYSSVIQAIHNVPGVISVNVPLGDCRRYGQSVGVVEDIVETPNLYPSLAAADFAMVVNLI